MSRTTRAHVESAFASFVNALRERNARNVDELALNRQGQRYKVVLRYPDSSEGEPFGAAWRTASEMWTLLRFTVDALWLVPVQPMRFVQYDRAASTDAFNARRIARMDGIKPNNDRQCPSCGHATLVRNEHNGQTFCTRLVGAHCDYSTSDS